MKWCNLSKNNEIFIKNIKKYYGLYEVGMLNMFMRFVGIEYDDGYVRMIVLIDKFIILIEIATIIVANDRSGMNEMNIW